MNAFVTSDRSLPCYGLVHAEHHCLAEARHRRSGSRSIGRVRLVVAQHRLDVLVRYTMKTGLPSSPGIADMSIRWIGRPRGAAGPTPVYGSRTLPETTSSNAPKSSRSSNRCRHAAPIKWPGRRRTSLRCTGRNRRCRSGGRRRWPCSRRTARRRRSRRPPLMPMNAGAQAAGDGQSRARAMPDMHVARQPVRDCRWRSARRRRRPSNGMTTSTGPKISSCAMVIELSTSTNSVGSTK